MADNWGLGEVDFGKWGSAEGELKICIYIPTPELYIHGEDSKEPTGK